MLGGVVMILGTHRAFCELGWGRAFSQVSRPCGIEVWMLSLHFDLADAATTVDKR